MIFSILQVSWDRKSVFKSVNCFWLTFFICVVWYTIRKVIVLKQWEFNSCTFEKLQCIYDLVCADKCCQIWCFKTNFWLLMFWWQIWCWLGYYFRSPHFSTLPKIDQNFAPSKATLRGISPQAITCCQIELESCSNPLKTCEGM